MICRLVTDCIDQTTSCHFQQLRIFVRGCFYMSALQLEKTIIMTKSGFADLVKGVLKAAGTFVNHYRLLDTTRNRIQVSG